MLGLGLVWATEGNPDLVPTHRTPLIRQTFKAVFECPSRRSWRALRPANSPWGLPLWRRRPPHPTGLGLWPWPRRVKLRPTDGGVCRGPSLFNCLLLPWGQLRTKCPPLPQPQHTGSRLPTTADLVGRSAVDCWRKCLISANSSQTKLVVKLVGASAAAEAICAAAWADDADVSSSASTCCTVVSAQHVLSGWK